MASTDQLRAAYAEGYAAALEGSEAAPGCTAGPLGQEWLRGYVAGAAARRLRVAPAA